MPTAAAAAPTLIRSHKARYQHEPKSVATPADAL
jgi:hypothetical protein